MFRFGAQHKANFLLYFYPQNTLGIIIKYIKRSKFRQLGGIYEKDK